MNNFSIDDIFCTQLPGGYTLNTGHLTGVNHSLFNSRFVLQIVREEHLAVEGKIGIGSLSSIIKKYLVDMMPIKSLIKVYV